MQKIGFEEAVEVLVDKNPNYDREAYSFIRDALDATVKKLKGEKTTGSKHVTPAQLLEGVKDYALKEYGPMAWTVLSFWGLHSSRDVGFIVFNLIEAGVFGKTESDRLEDFENGFDFHEAFVAPFLPAGKTAVSDDSV